MISIHQVIQRWPGPDVTIDCPVCLARGVPAVTYDQETRDKLYGLIPLNAIRTSWVVCSSCRRALRSRVPVDELDGMTALDLRDHIYVDAGFLRQTFAIIALCLALFPCVGTFIGVVVLIANWKLPGWPRTLSWIATGLSLLPTVVIGGLLVLDALGLISK